MIDFGLDPDPRSWIVHGGKPAACLGDGLPSYEHAENKAVVFDLLGVNIGWDGRVKCVSRWYGIASVLAPEGPVPLHHEPEAEWKWRPVMYNISFFYGIHAIGSQSELKWRWGLSAVMHHIYADVPLEDFDLVDARADAILLENLLPQQRLEWLATGGKFRVRGFSGDLYRIRGGDGFEMISPWTGDPWATFCLHPEAYMPDSDVSLALKLALEDEDLEHEVIGNASVTYQSIGRGAYEGEEYAMRLEKELIV